MVARVALFFLVLATGCGREEEETRFVGFEGPEKAVGEGWSGFEKTPRGAGYAWTRGPRATVRLLGRSDGDRSLRFRAWGPDVAVALRLNGSRLDTVRLRPRKDVYAVAAPEAAWRWGTNELVFVVEGGLPEGGSLALDWLEVVASAPTRRGGALPVRWLVALGLLALAVLGAARRGGAVATVLVLGVTGGLGLLSPFVRPMPTLLVSLALLNLACWWAPLPLAGFSRSRPGQVLLVALLGGAIPFGLGELLTRAGSDGGFWATAPLQTVLAPGTEDWRLALITADEHREPDPVLLWRPRDRPPYNRQRFKGPEVKVPKPEGVFRIIAYGDSNTDGPADGGWPRRLGERLEQMEPGRFEVLNAGVTGYSSYQGLQRFRQEVDAYRPDLVLVSFGWNDLPPALGAPDRTFVPPGRLREAVQRFLFKYQLYLSLRRLLAARGPAPGFAGPRVSLEEYRQNLRALLEEGARHGVAVVLLTRPHRAPVVEMEAHPSNWRSGVPTYNRALLDLAAETGAPSVDVADTFLSLGGTYFSDECHFTEEGHELMAERLLAALQAKGLLPLREPAAATGR